jgi:hypothetical protein
MISDPDRWATGINWASVVITYVVLSVHLFVFATIYSVTILFKPDSLQVIVPSVQVSVIAAG